MGALAVSGAVGEIHGMHSIDADQQDATEPSALTIVRMRRRNRPQCCERKDEHRGFSFSYHL
jgi:hypothetical protein